MITSRSPIVCQERQDARRSFLTDCGYAHWSCTPFSSDASFRRYFRLDRSGDTVLLMDAPPPEENVARFQLVANHLLDCGIRAPRVLASDRDSGFLIIEDFGDNTLTRLLNRGEDEKRLYTMAVDSLIALHRNGKATEIDVGVYDDGVLRDEQRLFVDWFFPAASGCDIGADAEASFHDAWGSVWQMLPAARQTLVLCDYHIDNIMRIGQGFAVDSCGLLDFQDAMIGPQCFDLMSLLEDARRDVSERVACDILAHYKNAMSTYLDPNFDAWYSAMAVHRHMRVLGVFVRLWRRDKKPEYLCHIPRVASLIQSHRGESELHPVFQWLDQHIPDLRQKSISLSRLPRPFGHLA